MKKIVKFLRPWKIYSPGDVAGFDAEQAEALIKARAAEAYEDPKGKPAK
jgi:hypothetical protein